MIILKVIAIFKDVEIVESILQGGGRIAVIRCKKNNPICGSLRG